MFFQSLGITFLQGYGQTEAGPVISCNRPSAGIRLDTVGPPVKNTEVRIAEDGEIMVRGENVMHGYWRNPEETARVLRGRLAGDRRRRPFRRQGPDRHHRPQEGPDRQRQGRQCLAAADRGHADAAAARSPRRWSMATAARTSSRCSCPIRRSRQRRTCTQRLQRAVDRVNADLSVIERVRRFILADEPSRSRTSS